MNLRWFNGALQVFENNMWTEVPVELDSEKQSVHQCEYCGQFFTNGHTCWVKNAET